MPSIKDVLFDRIEHKHLFFALTFLLMVVFWLLNLISTWHEMGYYPPPPNFFFTYPPPNPRPPLRMETKNMKLWKLMHEHLLPNINVNKWKKQNQIWRNKTLTLRLDNNWMVHIWKRCKPHQLISTDHVKFIWKGKPAFSFSKKLPRYQNSEILLPLTAIALSNSYMYMT